MKRLIFTLFLCFLGSTSSWAQEETATSPPVYNPGTKSYFQLIENRFHSYVWDMAQAEAQTKIYKGVRGRLAVVDSQETHIFILENFDIRSGDRSTWIGLRYWCNLHMLQWEGERPYSPSDRERFSYWHAEWARGESSCEQIRTSRLGYMPVYYMTVGGSTRWQATTLSKGFRSYLVEYPTGHE